MPPNWTFTMSLPKDFYFPFVYSIVYLVLYISCKEKADYGAISFYIRGAFATQLSMTFLWK